MANQSVSVFADAELSALFVIGGGSSNNRLDMAPGDVLTVTHTSASPPSTGSISVTGFSSSFWTVSGTLSVARGSSGTKTVKTGASPATLNLPVTLSGYSSGTIYINIVSSEDTEPDDFSGSLSNIIGANPSQEYFHGSFTISGINVSVTASVSGTSSPTFSVGQNGTKNSSPKTVQNGDTIYLYGNSSSTYNSSVTTTITVGTRTVSKTIQTQVDPASGTRIPFPVSSGTISMDDIRGFFGPANGTASLSNYYIGGTYVPNITTGTPNNNGVPSSGTIDLADFYNSCTTLYFTTAPSNKSDDANTVSTAQSLQVLWNKANDWEMGFGPDMEDSVDYQITHQTTFFQVVLGTLQSYDVYFGNASRDLTVAANRSSYTFAYDTSGNPNIRVEASVSASSEMFIGGEITLRARHKDSTSYTTSTTFTYYLNIFGP